MDSSVCSTDLGEMIVGVYARGKEFAGSGGHILFAVAQAKPGNDVKTIIVGSYPGFYGVPEQRPDCRS